MWTRPVTLCAVVAVLAMAVVSTPAGGEATIQRGLVAFSHMPPDIARRLGDARFHHVRLLEHARAALVVGPVSALSDVASWNEVLAVQPDVAFRPYMWQAVQTTRVDQVRIGAPPLNSVYTGKGVTVALVDTGVDTTHPDLSGQVIANYDLAPSAVYDRSKGWETPLIREPVETPVGVDPDHPHGTFLAGVIAGTGASAVRSDLRGVAHEAKLVNLKVVTAGLLHASSVTAAIDWIIEHHDESRFPGGIRVIVAGIGASVEVPVLRAALNRAIDAGIVVVFPAGNPVFSDEVTYPARYEEIIAVKGGCKDGWSAQGPLEWTGLPSPDELERSTCGPNQVFGAAAGETVDIVAPGADVWTPRPPHWAWAGHYPLWRPQPPGDDADAQFSNSLWYTPFVSPSLAAAHVAGIVALMLEADPCLMQADVERILKSAARDLPPTGFDRHSGSGMVDALRAVATAEDARAASGSC